MKLVLFALVGAICAIVIVGGMSSMMSESDVSTGMLTAGAVVGGVVGTASSYMMETEKLTELKHIFQHQDQEMRVGMPTF